MNNSLNPLFIIVSMGLWTIMSQLRDKKKHLKTNKGSTTSLKYIP